MHASLSELSLAERVRWAVGEHGPTQELFARKVGTSRERVNAWARGRSSIGEQFGRRIAEITGTEPELWLEEPERWLEDQVRELRQDVATLHLLVEAKAGPTDLDEVAIRQLVSLRRPWTLAERRAVEELADRLDRGRELSGQVASGLRVRLAQQAEG